MSGVFISYRQSDSKAWAMLLRDDLVELFGPDAIFLDRDALHAGPWRDQISQALAACSVTLLVIGRGWLTAADAQGRRLDQADDVHRHEIAHALGQKGMTVIPVLVDDATLPAPHDLPEDIRGLTECQARRLSDIAAHREVDVRGLASDIQRLCGLQTLASGPASAPPARQAQQHFLPFRQDEAQARSAFKTWAAGLLMAPSGFAQRAEVQDLVPSWVPHWRVQAQVRAHWLGRRGENHVPVTPAPNEAAKPRPSDNTDWTPVQGELNTSISDLVLLACDLSDDAPELLTAELVSHVQQAEQLPRAEVPAKACTTDAARAEDQAREAIGRILRQRIKTQIGGWKQEVDHLDVQHDLLQLTPVMAPMYEGHYTHAGKTYPCWVNGHNGAVGAPSPLGRGKVTLLVLAALLLVGVGVALYLMRR